MRMFVALSPLAMLIASVTAHAENSAGPPKNIVRNGDQSRGCHLHPARCKALARSNGQHRYDPYGYPGVCGRQECRAAGSSQRPLKCSLNWRSMPVGPMPFQRSRFLTKSLPNG